MRYGKFGDIPDPPEPVECNPENYDSDRCYYCAWEWYCRKEYEEHMKTLDARQVNGEVQDDKADD